MTRPPEGTGGDPGPRTPEEVWERLQGLPSMRDEPLVWDHAAGGFVAAVDPDPTVAMARPPVAPAPPGPPRAGGERRHVVITPEQGAGRAGSGAAQTPSGSGSGSGSAAGRGQGAAQAGPPRGAGGVRTAAPAPPPVVRAEPRPARSRRARRGRVGRRLRRRVLGIVLSLPVLLFGGLFAFGWVKFNEIPRVQVAGALSPTPGVGTNYLIVGTDSREGIEPGDPNADAFIADKVTGVRTDTIMVMRVQDGKQTLLSIPRDLYVKDPKTGESGRINATYQGGPANLVAAVRGLGIPVHHYLEINFVSFAKLVDAVGGIDIDFPYPTRDTHSGLYIDTPGVNHLDGTQALAYVRSRYYEELKEGKWVTDPESDLGRVKRQQQFLSGLLGKVTDTRNPAELSSVAAALSIGMKLDDSLGYLETLGLAWSLRGFHPESAALPVVPRTIGGAAVLELRQPDAQAVIDTFAA